MKTRCIDEETLGDFLEGRLAGEPLTATVEHLADCEQCLETLKIGGGLLLRGNSVDTLAVPDAVTQKAVTLVNRLNGGPELTTTAKVSNSIKEISTRVSRWFAHEFRGNLQLAPVRGELKFVSGNLIQVKKKFRSFQTGIEIEKNDPATATIRVSLLSDEKEPARIRVTLKKGAREVGSETMNAKLVVFENTPFGLYALVFSRRGEIIGNYKFEIKETVHEP